MKLNLLHLGCTFGMVLLLVGVAFAQPPGLPAQPSQAPIDGGLGLLAAAGGVYAFKKPKKKSLL